MQDLINYLLLKMNTLTTSHYETVDISDKIRKFNLAFNEYASVDENNDVQNSSKEILDDMLIHMYRNENDQIFVGCSTLENSDVFFRLDKPACDLQLISNYGVFVYSNRESDTEPYLSHAVLFREDNEKFVREVQGFDTSKFIEKNNEYIYSIYLRQKDLHYVCNTLNGEIIEVDNNYNIVKSITEDIKKLLPDTDFNKLNLKVISADIIIIEETDENLDILSGNIPRTYIYSIEKDMMLNEFDDINIHRVFNPNTDDIMTKSYIWLIENRNDKELIKKEIDELYSKNDLSDEQIKQAKEEIMLKNDKFISGLTNTFLLDRNNKNQYAPINRSSNDLGGVVEGLDIIYTILNDADVEKGYIFRFFLPDEEGNLVFEDAKSSSLPSNISVNKRTGIISFEFEANIHLDNDNFYKIKNIVNYFVEKQDILKYSSMMITVSDYSVFDKAIEDCLGHFIKTNNNEKIARDEYNALKRVKEILDPKMKTLYSTHYVNLTTTELFSEVTKLSFTKEAKIIQEEYADKSMAFKSRVRLPRTTEELQKEENEKDSKLKGEINGL